MTIEYIFFVSLGMFHYTPDMNDFHGSSFRRTETALLIRDIAWNHTIDSWPWKTISGLTPTMKVLVGYVKWSEKLPALAPQQVIYQVKIYGLVQDCSNSIASVLGLLQFCIKPSRFMHCIGVQVFHLYIPRQRHIRHAFVTEILPFLS